MVAFEAQASLPRWSIFLFFDLPTLKLRIIIIILLTDLADIILPTAGTTNNQVAFALEYWGNVDCFATVVYKYEQPILFPWGKVIIWILSDSLNLVNILDGKEDLM